MSRRGVASSRGSGLCASRAIDSHGSTMRYTGEAWATATRPCSSVSAGHGRPTRYRVSPSGAEGNRLVRIRSMLLKHGSSPAAWSPHGFSRAGPITSERSPIGSVACIMDKRSLRPTRPDQVCRHRRDPRPAGVSRGARHAWRALLRRRDSDGSPACLRVWVAVAMFGPVAIAAEKAVRSLPRRVLLFMLRHRL